MSYQISSTAYRQARTVQRNRNSVHFSKQQAGLGPVSNTLLLMFILSLMGLLYLTQITKTSTFGYRVNDLEVRKAALLEEQEALKVEASRLQALETIETSEVAQQLGPPTSTEFIQ